MANTTLEGPRLAQARQTAEALLDELELGSAPIMNAILKAKRLARLMRDEHAQLWLDLEASGYPPEFVYARLGTCEKYARAGARITSDNKYYYNSLPQFEADLESSRMALHGIQFPSNVAPSVSSSNPHELTGIHLSNAVKNLTDTYVQSLAASKANHSSNARIFNGLKSVLHNYATDCHHALSLSDAAGKSRKVGAEEYKNRLLAFLDRQMSSKTTSSMAQAELEAAASRVDALYEKACKGVHSEVTSDEVRLVLISVYLLLAEVVRLSEAPVAAQVVVPIPMPSQTEPLSPASPLADEQGAQPVDVIAAVEPEARSEGDARSPIRRRRTKE